MPESAKPLKKRCFVVGPIGKPESEVRVHADWFFDGIVLPVFRQMDDLSHYSVIRADKISAPGMIDAQIIGQLLDADLVIADLSKTNPNAFYEIGIRHMIEKPIIHMHEDGGDIPFDISLYRSIPFTRNTPADLVKAQGNLGEAIKAVLAPEYKCDNPVIRARGRIKVEQTAAPEQKVILDRIQALESRVNVMEGSASLDESSSSLSGPSTVFDVFYNPSGISFNAVVGVIRQKIEARFGLTGGPGISYSLGDRAVRVRVAAWLDKPISEDINQAIQALKGVVSVVTKVV